MEPRARAAEIGRSTIPVRTSDSALQRRYPPPIDAATARYRSVREGIIVTLVLIPGLPVTRMAAALETGASILERSRRTWSSAMKHAVKSHLSSLVTFLVVAVLPALVGSLHTAYRAEVLHERIKFGWGLVPFVVLFSVIVAAAYYGLAALLVAALTGGSFSPRGTWSPLLAGVLYFALSCLPQLFLPDSDFAWLLGFLGAPLVSLVLFRRDRG